MSIYSMWGSSLIIAPAGFPVATESLQRKEMTSTCVTLGFGGTGSRCLESSLFFLSRNTAAICHLLYHTCCFLLLGQNL